MTLPRSSAALKLPISKVEPIPVTLGTLTEGAEEVADEEPPEERDGLAVEEILGLLGADGIDGRLDLLLTLGAVKVGLEIVCIFGSIGIAL